MPRGSWNERRTRKARQLLHPALDGAAGAWADLGCGDGVFTRLLAAWLARGSTVYAVDQDPRALRALERHLADAGSALGNESAPGVRIQTVRADFTQPLDLPLLNGMLMANSLHFVHHKAPVLRQLVELLMSGGRIIIIEYNAERGNPAVPHPISADACLALMRTVGLRDAHIATTAPSSFLGEMYAAVAHRPAPDTRS